MKIDLLHNKIIAETASDAFKDAFFSAASAYLGEKYGESCEAQMYEDHISSGYFEGKTFYYPLSVKLGDSIVTEWAFWNMKKNAFKGDNPFAYCGREALEISFGEAPVDIAAKHNGAYCFDEKTVKLRVDTPAPDFAILSGKYSQRFIDVMALALGPIIEGAAGVSGIADSSVELHLVFAPGTYMEHTSENVTYRRLLLVDKGSAPRDFWVKWTRLDGEGAYSIADDIDPENILFEIGEDVPQKIKEKEYRFLTGAGKDKYHNAMGRKNVTEWREVLKRAAKRGDLIRTSEPAPRASAKPKKVEISAAAFAESTSASENSFSPSKEDEELDRAMEMARRASDSAPAEPEKKPENDESEIDEIAKMALKSLALLKAQELSAEREEAAVAVKDEPVLDEEPVAFDLAKALALAEEALNGSAEAEADTDTEIEFSEDETAEPEAEEISFEEYAPIQEAEQIEDKPEEDEALEVELTEDEALEVELTEDKPEEDKILEVELTEDEPEEDEALEVESPEEEALDREEEAAEEIAPQDAIEEVDDIDEVEFDDEEIGAEDEELLALEALAAAKADAPVVVPDDPTEEEYLESELDDDRLSDEADAETLRDLRALEPDEDEAPEAFDIEKIKEALEAKIRLEYESRARQKAEEEAERLRREHEQLRMENERLAQRALREQSERERAEENRRSETEQLRAQIEAQLRREAKEKERIAEAARIAVEEQQKLELERLRAERIRLEDERTRREEQKRLEEERIAEERRLAREAEEAKVEQKPEIPAAPEKNYTFVSKTVSLLFRKSVDPNLVQRIHATIKATLEYLGKQNVPMKIKASIPNSNTVRLDFIRFPLEEMELLGNIIKIMGNNNLGIAKAIID